MDEAIGDGPASPVVVSCGSGYAATVLLLAMARLGIDAALHDDSFAVWRADPARPVQRDTPTC